MWSQDIHTIRITVSELILERDVDAILHSFSGITGGTALEGLDKATCASKGLKGGVVRLIYLMAFIVPEGLLAKDLRPQSLGSFWSTTTYAAWRDIPTTYILCTKDKPTTVGFARRLVDAAN